MRKTHKRWPLLFVLFVSHILSACSHSTPAVPDNPEKLTEQFVYLTLGVEPIFKDISNTSGHLKKWLKPLRIRLFAADNVDRKSIVKDMDRLSAPFVKLLEHLNIDYHTVDDDSWNFAYFIYSNKDDFLEIREAFKSNNSNGGFENLIQAMNLVLDYNVIESGRGCFVTVYSHIDETDRNTFGSIHRVFIFLPNYGQQKLRQACFMEESVQALGVPNDYGIKRPHYSTIFDDLNDNAELTPADIRVLEALYDDRISHGANEQELRQLLPTVFKDFLERDSIASGS